MTDGHRGWAIKLICALLMASCIALAGGWAIERMRADALGRALDDEAELLRKWRVQTQSQTSTYAGKLDAERKGRLAAERQAAHYQNRLEQANRDREVARAAVFTYAPPPVPTTPTPEVVPTLNPNATEIAP